MISPFCDAHLDLKGIGSILVWLDAKIFLQSLVQEFKQYMWALFENFAKKVTLDLLFLQLDIVHVNKD